MRTGTATGTAVITVDAAGDNTIVVSPGANATLEPGDLPSFDDVAVLTLCLEIGVPTVLAAARAVEDDVAATHLGGRGYSLLGG